MQICDVLVAMVVELSYALLYSVLTWSFRFKLPVVTKKKVEILSDAKFRDVSGKYLLVTDSCFIYV